MGEDHVYTDEAQHTTEDTSALPPSPDRAEVISKVRDEQELWKAEPIGPLELVTLHPD